MAQGRGNMKRVGRYLRVSRSDQHLGLQADETLDLVTRRGWELVDSYCDEGVSGTREKRPELDRMLQDARKGRFDVLVVWRSDRLFRSLKHFISTLEELTALNIDFVSATEPFDSTVPSGKLMFNIVASFAEFERHLLIERTRSGLEAARRRGVRIGRPRVYVDVLRARDLRSKGIPLREIARRLGAGAATIHRALQQADGRDDGRDPEVVVQPVSQVPETTSAA